MRFWLGGYTADMHGDAVGIGVLQAGDADSPLAGGPLALRDTAAAVASPSWLVAHPSLDVVYAALEGAGSVQAFRRTGELTLAPLGAPVAAGDTVCHVAVAPDGRSLVASCYGDGRVVRMPLDAAGRPTGARIAAAATDPYGDAAESDVVDLGVREEQAFDLSALLRAAAGEEPEPAVAAPTTEDAGARVSRAHTAAFLPDGRVATTDLGFDVVRIWRQGAVDLVADHEVALPRGCGPRHVVVHPSGHLYVVTEYSCEVFVLGRTPAGRWALIGATALGAGIGADDAAAELATSRDGEFLYAGLRGTDTIATVRVRGTGDRLEPTALAESGVHWPRHHVVVGDALLVAGQRSGEVSSLALDIRTGVPGRVRHRVEAPTPTCLLPMR